MRRRPAIALIAAVALLAPAAAGAEGNGPRAVYVGTYVWTSEEPGFGAFSGIDLEGDGLGFRVVADNGHTLAGRLERNAEGAVTGVEAGPLIDLKDEDGGRLRGKRPDAEGLALGEGDRFFVSFEREDRIEDYPSADDAPGNLTAGMTFEGFVDNRGFEALAISDDGSLYAIPEISPVWRGPFPVYVRRNGAWAIRFSLASSGTWRPVGADFGPDGRLYVLERDYWGFVGFMSRVRRVTLDGDRVVADEVLLQTRAKVHDNLEGLAVWQDATGAIHLTMISDDNLLRFQQTQIVEYRVEE